MVDDIHKDFDCPVQGIVTSRYGYRKGRYHNGIDLNLRTGDTVKAAFSGRVRYAKWNDGGFGNLVIIRHHNGLETFYAHLSKHLVAPDQEVKAGEPIGLGGNTGRSFGAHLHFEVRFYDAPMNPEEDRAMVCGSLAFNVDVKAVLDRIAPNFEKGGRFERWYPLWEAADTFFYTPHAVTRTSALRKVSSNRGHFAASGAAGEVFSIG